MKPLLDLVIDLLPRLAAMTVCIVFLSLLARFAVRTVSIWSLWVNATHLALTLMLPGYFRRQKSGQYHSFVGVIMTAEFLMVLAIVIPLIYSLCSPRIVYPPGAYGLSIDVAPEPVQNSRPPAIDWYWAGAGLISFVSSIAIIFKLG